MIRLLRITGFLLMAAGALILATYLIEPLRFLWPWLLRLPLPIRIGLAAAGLGLVLLIGTLLYERLEERDQDRRLREEE
jgi:hypothetical protein